MRLMLLTLLAMLAFVGNSVLCRLALAHTSIDAASFTTLRLLSGTLMLGLLVWLRPRAACALQRPRTSSRHPCRLGGDWPSALALFAYAAATAVCRPELVPCCCLARCRPP